MSAYTDGLEDAAFNAFCDVSRASVAAGVLFAAFTATTGAGVIAGLAGSALAAHLYASYCGRPMPPPEPGEPQDWTGGQCEDVPYRITIGFALILSPLSANINVGRVAGVFDGIGKVTLAEAYDTGSQDNDIRVRASWKGGSGNVSVVKGTNNDSQNPQWGYQDVIITVVRQDGMPDLCGDPAPNPGPDRFDNDRPIVYVTPEGDTINAPVNFNFGPAFIGVGAAVFIPVDLTFNLTPTLNLSGTININTGGFTPTIGPPDTPITGGDGPGDIVTPPNTPPAPPPSVPPDPPKPPQDPKKPKPIKIIRGVIVTSLIEGKPTTVIFQENIPDIFAPNLGYVSFLYFANDVYAWSADIPIKNAKQLVECPWQYGAVDVRGQGRPGVEFNLLPLYDFLNYTR